ncbi:MAG: VOC family protein [Alphaproteobacteria bacterium]|nr:VOC family protein [Alphaproteobacteria bacterium]
MTVSSITPFLWFDKEAEAAANFYVSLFPGSKIEYVSPGPTGAAMVVGFEIFGQRLTALNGGPMFKLNEAFSLMVSCSDQAEIDRLWNALCEGGTPSVGGWLKDRFGLSWQINFAGLPKLMSGRNAGQVMGAMCQMSKIDVARLSAIAAG